MFVETRPRKFIWLKSQIIITRIKIQYWPREYLNMMDTNIDQRQKYIIVILL